MKILVIGDLHLTPDETLLAEDLPIDDHDVVLSIGDIIHENKDCVRCTNGEEHEKVGRKLFESLNESGVVVISVPGNHDPVRCTKRLTKGLENIVVLHKEAVSIPSMTDSNDFPSFSVVGWGCERLEVKTDIPAPNYPEIPEVNTVGGKDFDDVAGYIEKVTYKYVTGQEDDTYLREKLLDTNVTGPRGRMLENKFKERLSRLEDRFTTIKNIIDGCCGDVLIASHISPFNSSFDFGFSALGTSHGLGQSPRGHTPSGSLALLLAILEESPSAVISGHSHISGTQTRDTPDGQVHLHNPGHPGITSLELGGTKGFELSYPVG